MSKILSGNGYSLSKTGTDPQILAKCRRDLTIEPFIERPEYGAGVEPIKIYHETQQRMYMPRFYGIKEFGEPDVDKITKNNKNTMICENIKMKSEFKHLDFQVPIAKKLLDQLKNHHGGVLSLYCGAGKTLGFGLWSATELKLRTIVVCHTTDMMGQWKDEINKWLPTAKVGIIQQDKAEIEGNDIIIASLKTLAQRSFSQDFFSSVGLVIWDEIHLMCTTLFSDAFPKLCTLYSLGLSATPHRKDKCEKIFQYFIGPIFHMEKRAGDSSVEVRCVVFKSPVVIKKNFKNELQYTTTLLGVVYAQDRINYLVQEIVDQVKIGRKMLVLGEYVKHLKQLKEGLEKHPEFKDAHVAGLYVGEMKNAQRVVSKEADVILGTYKMASVGMNIPTLDTVLLGKEESEKSFINLMITQLHKKLVIIKGNYFLKNV
jgi:superfamily II DNA or RNA helicase